MNMRVIAVLWQARSLAAELLRVWDIAKHEAHINQIRVPYQRTTRVARSAYSGGYACTRSRIGCYSK